MPFKRQKSNVSPHYHDTRTLLRKYRDVMWNLEVSDLDLQEEFNENDSEIETVARDCIGGTVAYILKWFDISIDIEEAIRERDW